MQLSEVLEGLGRYVAYSPQLAKLTGVKECILLTQLIFWTGKQADKEGWIYKTQAELEDETGLSEGEQFTARKNLKAKGLLEEKQARLEHKLFYRIKRNALDKLWSDSRNPEPRIRGEANPGFGERQTPDSSNGEMTSEMTSEKIQRDSKSKEPSEHKRFTEAWFAAFEAHFHRRYGANGQDWKAVKNLLSFAGSVEAAVAIAKRAWAANGTMPAFLSQRAVTIHGLMGSWNEIQCELDKPVPQNRFACAPLPLAQPARKLAPGIDQEVADAMR